ncbi:hypothetical protein [Arthrobacter sp. H16F315]|uniref:hypothetical protein n=1 Tax=Arthrobacter sp. H16F315 TaxID=2955314 RepID=UPI002098234B|nr:hypothetical protein [Arthrobacter sp. H16F315]MDD1478122.1 hypothetical protein [Arthrobacter sp. H16F315]
MHRQDPGSKSAQRDPAGHKVPPGCVVFEARCTRAFYLIEEGHTVRSNVGKTNGPDGGPGDGECSSVL